MAAAGDALSMHMQHTPQGGEFAYPMVVSFTEEELALMASNQFSSTLREILCIKVLLEVGPASNQYKRLRYEILN